MDSIELSLDTTQTPFLDLTPGVRRFCDGRGDGLLSVFAPHATAGVALFELGAGSPPLNRSAARSVRASRPHPLESGPASGAPASSRHASGAASLRSEPMTGQSVVLVDPNPDNPRRKVRLSFLAG